MTLALLLTAVTGAWAQNVLNLVLDGTSATIKYDGNTSNNPYLGDHDWEKSGNPWDMEFTTRSTITTVTIDGSCKNFSGTSLNSLFYMFSGLTTINGLENLNTANVQDIRYMFARCSSLTSLDLSSVKTASVTTMSQMFIGCSKLTSLDLSSWNTENVETTTGLFTNCSELTTVDLSGWNTANVLNTASMFYNCLKLENIYVGDGWSTAAVTNSKLMFTGCTKLPNFDANKVDKTNAHTGEGGYLKVKPAGIDLTPDATRKVWTLDKMPASDIELQVEYYPESYLFLSKEALADKASIAVTAGDLGVQFGEDGKSANPVAEGTAMTVKYNGAKKILGMKVGKYNPDPKAVPLTFEVLTNGTIKVSFPRNGMKYSLNGGEKTAVPGGSESDISVKAGDIIEFYGNGSSYYNMGSDHTSIGGTAEVKVYGNIMSLLSETNFATATTLTAEQTFRELFRSYSKLTDASGLLLPAMTLTNNCYYEMFYSCSGMTAAPAELPAETLASSCYYEMFSSCSKLTTAPVLPATSLVSNCYRSMFSYCYKLSSVTCLATSGIDSNNSTYSWMQSAGSQAAGDKTFTADKTASWSEGSNNGIPSGWTRVDYVAPGN